MRPSSGGSRRMAKSFLPALARAAMATATPASGTGAAGRLRRRGGSGGGGLRRRLARRGRDAQRLRGIGRRLRVGVLRIGRRIAGRVGQGEARRVGRRFAARGGDRFLVVGFLVAVDGRRRGGLAVGRRCGAGSGVAASCAGCPACAGWAAGAGSLAAGPPAIRRWLRCRSRRGGHLGRFGFRCRLVGSDHGWRGRCRALHGRGNDDGGAGLGLGLALRLALACDVRSAPRSDRAPPAWRWPCRPWPAWTAHPPRPSCPCRSCRICRACRSFSRRRPRRDPGSPSRPGSSGWRWWSWGSRWSWCRCRPGGRFSCRCWRFLCRCRRLSCRCWRFSRCPCRPAGWSWRPERASTAWSRSEAGPAAAAASWLGVWDGGGALSAGGGGGESSIRLANGELPALAWL